MIFIIAGLYLINFEVIAKRNRFMIKYKNVVITPGDNVTDYINKLGRCNNISKFPSCLTEGYDYIYDFDKLIITTYSLDKNKSATQYVSSIELKSKKIKTMEGLKIGDKEKKVLKKYKKAKKKYGVYTMKKGNTKIIIGVKNKKVKSILICNK